MPTTPHPDTPLADSRFAPDLEVPAPPWRPVPLVQASRNGVTESVHVGAIAVCDLQGNVLASAGDVGVSCYLRSGAKPFQAIPLFGRADLLAEYAFSAPEMALICASHLGEPKHVEAGRSLFKKIGIDPLATLKNGLDLPSRWEDVKAMVVAGEEPTVLHHNCSGNHAGFLALAKAGGHDLETYQLADHPVQVPCHGLMGALAGVPEGELRIGVDNCGVPAYWMTLHQAATAFARLANPLATAQLGLPLPFAADVFLHGARRVAGAMWTAPDYTAGTGHLNTFTCTVGKGRFLGKNGAEGFYGIGVAGAGEYPQITAPPPGACWTTDGPHAGQALGIAVKIWDGDAAKRGVSHAVLETLYQLGLLPRDAAPEETAALLKPVRRTHRGDREIGRVYPVFELR
ncbi:MAG TPA: asparaginase [bacterium]|nr:asparaginase [bacterium]